MTTGKKVYRVGYKLFCERKRLFRKLEFKEFEEWGLMWQYSDKPVEPDMYFDDYYTDTWADWNFPKWEILYKKFVFCEVENCTLENIKDRLSADEFLNYCKDRLLPIQVVIA